MTPKEFYETIKYWSENCKTSGQIEDNHRAADRLMCEILTELGYGEGVKVFEDMKKWYA